MCKACAWMEVVIMKERRVGTFTLGIVLVIFGVLFLIHSFFREMDYSLIFVCWPLIFIILGGEVLYYALHQSSIEYKYDFAAVVIIVMLVIFAMGMACADCIYYNYPKMARML